MLAVIQLKKPSDLERILDRLAPFYSLLEGDKSTVVVSFECTQVSVLRECLEQISLKYGMGSSRWVATLALTKEAVVLEGEEKKFLAPFPVSVLPIAEKQLERLRMLGMKTLEDIQSRDWTPIFGEDGLKLKLLAEGKCFEAKHSPASEEVVIQEWEVETEIEVELAHMFREGCEELKRRNQLACASLLTLFGEDGSSIELKQRYRSPLDDPERALKLMILRVQSLTLSSPIQKMTLKLCELVVHAASQSMLFPVGGCSQKARLERVAQRLDVQDRTLYGVVWDDPSAVIPERWAHLRELKEIGCTRPLYTPRPISVVLSNSQQPYFVALHRSWQRVEMVVDEWEVSEKWWDLHRIHRSYYRVLLTSGKIVRLFFDHIRGSWYEQGV